MRPLTRSDKAERSRTRSAPQRSSAEKPHSVIVQSLGDKFVGGQKNRR